MLACRLGSHGYWIAEHLLQDILSRKTLPELYCLPTYVIVFIMKNTNSSKLEAHPIEVIASHVLSIRRLKVLIDIDFAALYGVETKVLLQAVKRNSDRFPDDFMFQLNTDEWHALRSQSVTSNTGRGGRSYAPYAFTDEAIAGLIHRLSDLMSPKNASTKRPIGFVTLKSKAPLKDKSS